MVIWDENPLNYGSRPACFPEPSEPNFNTPKVLPFLVGKVGFGHSLEPRPKYERHADHGTYTLKQSQQSP